MDHQRSVRASSPVSSLSTNPVEEIRRKTTTDLHNNTFGTDKPQSTADGSDDPTFHSLSPSTFIQKQHHSETTWQQDQSHPTHPATELIEKPLSHDAQAARRPGQVLGAKGRLTDWLLLELLSWTFSALCLVAIIILLKVYDKKTLPHWPYKVTLNFVVSILATAARASMLLPVVEALSQLKWDWFSKSSKLADFGNFDAASRGPLGSIQLIIGLKGSHLASLGATIILVALAFEPFLQQIISYPSEPIPSSNSTLARSDIYANNTDQATYELNLYMKGAVYNGIFNPQPPGSGLEYSCRSGNCTWDIYDTIGVCSTCQDVSSQLKPNCSQVHRSFGVCSYMLPDNIIGISGQGIVLSMSTTQLYNDTHGFLENVTNSLSFAHITDPIVDFYTLWYPNASADNSPWDINDTSLIANDVGLPLASECVLYWCSKTLKSTMFNATYDEVVLDSWRLDQRTFALDSNGDYTFKSPSSGSTLALNQRSRSVMAAYMTRFFNAGHVNVDVGTSSISNRTTQIYSSDVVQTIYHSLTITRTNNLTGLIGNLATSMTNSLRNMNNGNGPLLGTTIEYQTYVHIRWAWISLPAALVLLTLAYLVTVIVKSNTQKNPIWKSSSLAVLFHGLDPTTWQELGRLQRLHEMDAQAEMMKIRLSEGNEGLRLLREDRKRI